MIALFPPDLDVRPSNLKPGHWIVYNRQTGNGVCNPNGEDRRSFFTTEEAARKVLTEWQETVANVAAMEAAKASRKLAVPKGWKRCVFHPFLRDRERGKDAEGFDVVPLPAYQHPDAPGLVAHKSVNGGYCVSHAVSGLSVLANWRPANQSEARAYALAIAPLTDWTVEKPAVSRELMDGVRKAAQDVSSGEWMHRAA